MSLGRFRFHMLQPLKSAPGLEFEQNSIAVWFKTMQNTGPGSTPHALGS